MEMNIVYMVTRNMYEDVKASLASLYATSAQGCNVYILAEDDNMPFPIPEHTSVINVSDQKFFTKENCVNYDGEYKYIVLLSVVLHRILPESVDKCIVLDCDTIIYEDIYSLFTVDMGKHLVAAVPEPMHPMPGYCNLGVGLYNLEAFRKNPGIVDDLIAYIRTIQKPTPDQYAFAEVLGEDMMHLDPRWNACPFTNYDDKDVAIRHYASCSYWKDLEAPRKWFKVYDTVWK